MNRSTGMPRPCSWKDTKLTMYPSRPRLWLARQSNPLRPIGVGDRAEKAIVDERPQHLHGHVGPIPRIHREDDRAARHCAVEDAATAVSLSLSLPLPSPFFSPVLSDPSNSSREAKVNAGKVRRGETRLVAYLCRKGTKWTGDEIGELSLKSGTVNPDPI